MVHLGAPTKKKMTYEEFLDWCDEDTWAEWVEGCGGGLCPVCSMCSKS